ncbi:hypothetical protein Tco_0199664 [Tanacetum coccineum]
MYQCTFPEPVHPEVSSAAADEAPYPLLPPSFLSPRIRPLSPRALAAEMRDVASSLHHALHPSWDNHHCYIYSSCTIQLAARDQLLWPMESIAVACRESSCSFTHGLRCTLKDRAAVELRLRYEFTVLETEVHRNEMAASAADDLLFSIHAYYADVPEEQTKLKGVRKMPTTQNNQRAPDRVRDLLVLSAEFRDTFQKECPKDDEQQRPTFGKSRWDGTLASAEILTWELRSSLSYRKTDHSGCGNVYWELINNGDENVIRSQMMILFVQLQGFALSTRRSTLSEDFIAYCALSKKGFGRGVDAKRKGYFLLHLDRLKIHREEKFATHDLELGAVVFALMILMVPLIYTDQEKPNGHADDIMQGKIEKPRGMLVGNAKNPEANQVGEVGTSCGWNICLNAGVGTLLWQFARTVIICTSPTNQILLYTSGSDKRYPRYEEAILVAQYEMPNHATYVSKVFDLCSRSRPEHQRLRIVVQPNDTEWKWDKSLMDFVTKLPKMSQGYAPFG